MDSLEAFFNPQSVVVIGASREPEKLGYGVARNLIGSGFPGEIYLVNLKGGEVFGYPLYTSSVELPPGIDLGLVVVPAKNVPATLYSYSQIGIKNYIILTGGFSEAGEEGAAIESEVEQLIRQEGLRVIGPNCIGIVDTHLPLDTTFIQPPMPDPGSVAFISHSGALGAAMIDWARGEGFGFSRVVSLGNQVDVTESDVLLPTAMSEDTRVVAIYLEGIRGGRQFVSTATEASMHKPVIVYKVGRSEAGQKAAASHTGALAGANAAYQAAFRRAGLLPAGSTEEMFSWAKLFASAPQPKGNRVAILTNAGGPGVAAVDATVDAELSMAEYSEDTRRKLAKILPPAASIANPVDMLASASPDVYADCLEILLEDPGVDMALVIAPPPPMFEAAAVAVGLISVIQASNKPVAVSFMGSCLVSDGILLLRKAGIPEYSFPEAAISALGALWRYVKTLARDQSLVEVSLPVGSRESVNEILSRLSGGSEFVDPEMTVKVLAGYELPMLPLFYARKFEQAVEAAAQAGFPVAIKLAAADVSHKSDLGGVLLGMSSKEAVREAVQTLQERYLAGGGAFKKFGVYVQRMAPAGQEVILGAVRDPIFGPMVMFGAGGTEVEGLGDVAFALAPLSTADLDYLLDSTWAGRRLKGFRHLHPADMQAVRLAIARLGQLMADHPGIEEIEVNPLIVGEVGAGCYGADARMKLAKGS